MRNSVRLLSLVFQGVVILAPSSSGQLSDAGSPTIPLWAVYPGQCDWDVIELDWSGNVDVQPPDVGCLGAAEANAQTKAGGMQIWGSSTAANLCPFPFNPTVSNTASSAGDGNYKIELALASPGCLPRYEGRWKPKARLFAHLIDAPAAALAAGRMEGKVKVTSVVAGGMSGTIISVNAAGGVGRDSGATGQVSWTLGSHGGPITFTPSAGEGSSSETISANDSGEANLDGSAIVTFSGNCRVEASAKRGGVSRTWIKQPSPGLKLEGLCKNVLTGGDCSGRVFFLYGWSGK